MFLSSTTIVSTLVSVPLPRLYHCCSNIFEAQCSLHRVLSRLSREVSISVSLPGSAPSAFWLTMGDRRHFRQSSTWRLYSCCAVEQILARAYLYAVFARASDNPAKIDIKRQLPCSEDAS